MMAKISKEDYDEEGRVKSKSRISLSFYIRKWCPTFKIAIKDRDTTIHSLIDQKPSIMKVLNTCLGFILAFSMSLTLVSSYSDDETSSRMKRFGMV